MNPTLITNCLVSIRLYIEVVNKKECLKSYENG